MRLPVLLVALGLAIGCSTAGDPVVLKAALDEAANIGSQAKVAGPRSPAEIARTTAQVASLQANIRLLGAPR